jgi:hypothetical protein
MEIKSVLEDERISAKNILVEMPLGEYAGLIHDILSKNEFQRKRVKSSKTVYALLKEDLLKNCIIPPIVLALTSHYDIDEKDSIEFTKIINSKKTDLVILDGLQRTHTIIDLIAELVSEKNETDLTRLLSNKIRVEIYIGLNRLGILYRMLTLNTGQTPMSLRQQIEILYLDYANTPLKGINLITEKDDASAKLINDYNFKEVIEGFNSYITRDEQPFDRTDLLENISSMEKLSKENNKSEIFEDYLEALNSTIVKIDSLLENSELNEDIFERITHPFGKNSLKAFKRPQVYSGFGAAIGKMIDFGILKNIKEVLDLVKGITIDNPVEFLEQLNFALDEVAKKSRKIGNAQRSYFVFFFRELFNPGGDSYQSPEKAIEQAKQKYMSQYS